MLNNAVARITFVTRASVLGLRYTIIYPIAATGISNVACFGTNPHYSWMKRVTVSGIAGALTQLAE